MNPLTAERIARNDSAFREANEQIGAKAKEHHTAAAQPVPFICECADPSCTSILQLTLVEYEDVRADSRQFMNALGHERVEGPIDVILQISRSEYEAVHAQATHFVLHPGHVQPEIEHVVWSHPGYDVAKEGSAAEVARDLSRRPE